MASQPTHSTDTEARTGVATRISTRETPIAERVTREQCAVLFALHNDLCQHQQSVNQAFTSLDQACRALVASIVAHRPSTSTATPPPEGNHATTSADPASHSTATTAASSSTPNARQFAQLLRQVEALHQFLFTNLYVHQRECALQLLTGVERTVLAAEPALRQATRSAEGICEQNDEALSNDNDTSDDAAGWAELRSQINQLRYRLFTAPLALPQSRAGPLSAEGSTAIGLSTAAAVTAAAESSPTAAASSTSWAVAVPSEQPPQRSVRRRLPRLFALSATFAALGDDGQRNLTAVLNAVQRRFHLHGVVLGGTTGAVQPQEEMQLATQLGCVCLVVPHARRKMFPVPPPIPIASDRDVLAFVRGRDADSAYDEDDHEQRPHQQRRGGTHTSEEAASATYATSPPRRVSVVSASDSDEENDLMGGDAVDPDSALARLFEALEVDDVVSSWPPPPTTAPSEHDDAATAAAEKLVVRRAALKREGRPHAHREKRRRYGSTAASSPSPSGTSVVERTEEAETGLAPPAALDDAVSEGDAITPPHVRMSQHIGLTQCGPPQLSSNAAASTPASLPTRPVFQISNSVKYLKPQLMEAIAQLGGTVDLSSGYSHECRFLVVAEGITERTEKYLGACAAAAYIVPPRYVFDSQRRGYWLSNRVHEYDMSPQRVAAHQPRPPPIFRSWRVLLITCRSAAARGVRAALLAGGCAQATAFVVDLTAESPISASARAAVVDESCAVDGVVEGVCPTSTITADTLAAATHILVECNSVTGQGYFQLPDWVPVCVRRPEYACRIFTLELLYFCLCAHPERIFDDAGLLCDEGALTPACRVEPA